MNLGWALLFSKRGSTHLYSFNEPNAFTLMYVCRSAVVEEINGGVVPARPAFAITTSRAWILCSAVNDWMPALTDSVDARSRLMTMRREAGARGRDSRALEEGEVGSRTVAITVVEGRER